MQHPCKTRARCLGITVLNLRQQCSGLCLLYLDGFRQDRAGRGVFGGGAGEDLYDR